MASRFIDNIPKEFQPDETENFEHLEVIRGVYSNQMVVNNFLPTYIERPKDKSFIPPDRSYYSLSLFTSINALTKALKPYPKKMSSIVGFAQGYTTIQRGISLKAESTGHINYFLYDYKGNNPCADFCYYADK